VAPIIDTNQVSRLSVQILSYPLTVTEKSRVSGLPPCLPLPTLCRDFLFKEGPRVFSTPKRIYQFSSFLQYSYCGPLCLRRRFADASSVFTQGTKPNLLYQVSPGPPPLPPSPEFYPRPSLLGFIVFRPFFPPADPISAVLARTLLFSTQFLVFDADLQVGADPLVPARRLVGLDGISPASSAGGG